MVKHILRSIKNVDKVLNKLKSTGFLTSTVSAYDFYTLCTLSHTLIKEELTELIDLTCKSEGLLYLY